MCVCDTQTPAGFHNVSGSPDGRRRVYMLVRCSSESAAVLMVKSTAKFGECRSERIELLWSTRTIPEGSDHSVFVVSAFFLNTISPPYPRADFLDTLARRVASSTIEYLLFCFQMPQRGGDCGKNIFRFSRQGFQLTPCRSGK